MKEKNEIFKRSISVRFTCLLSSFGFLSFVTFNLIDKSFQQLYIFLKILLEYLETRGILT